MLYLYFGSNDLARTEAVQALKATLPEDVRDLNLTVLDGRKLKPPAFTVACEAFPFLHDRRLVIVEDALKGLRSSDVRDKVRDYLPKVPPTTDLLFVESEDFDKRSALFAYLKKMGEVREFLPYQGAELTRWLNERARSLGVKLAPDAMQLLIEFVSSDSRALASELAKLAAYADLGGSITQDSVRLLVADSSESSIFDFIDALASRRLGPALRLLRDLLSDGQAPTYLLFMIGRQVRLLLAISELSKSRLRPDDMAAQLGQKPFVVRKAAEQAARFTPAALLTLHDRLTELDHWSKTGHIEGDTALELLIAETCR